MFVDYAATVAILTGLVDLFMILGTILITTLVGFISYWILTAYGNW